jgi:hypothetical protein
MGEEIKKGKSYAQRQAGAGKTDEKRDGRTGAERSNGTQEGGHDIGRQTLETPHDLFAAFRRKITLNIGNDENQHAEQDGNLEHIIQKELQAAAPAPGNITTGTGQETPDQII